MRARTLEWYTWCTRTMNHARRSWHRRYTGLLLAIRVVRKKAHRFYNIFSHSTRILNRRLSNFWTNQITSFSQIWPLQQLKAEDICMWTHVCRYVAKVKLSSLKNVSFRFCPRRQAECHTQDGGHCVFQHTGSSSVGRQMTDMFTMV